MSSLRIATIIGTTTFVVVGLATYFYQRVRQGRVKPLYHLPWAWQHPSAVPGSWDQAIAVTPGFGSESHRYYCAVFEDGRDYVGTYLGVEEINSKIQEVVAKGYVPVAPEFHECYGV
jgi:hypothetical protein